MKYGGRKLVKLPPPSPESVAALLTARPKSEVIQIDMVKVVTVNVYHA